MAEIKPEKKFNFETPAKPELAGDGLDFKRPPASEQPVVTEPAVSWPVLITP